MKISEEAGFPQPDSRAIGSRLGGLKMYLDKTNWKNPEMYQAVLFMTNIEFNISNNSYKSVKMADCIDFRKLVEIVGLYNSRALTCDFLAETDYLFWVHCSIMQMVAYVADKSPSPDLASHCEQALRFFDKLSSDYPTMVEFRSIKLLTMQRKAALEMALGRIEAARFAAREALKHARDFQREFPDAYDGHFLVIHALIQNLKLNSDLTSSSEKTSWETEVKTLIAEASTRWPEVGFGESHTKSYQLKEK